MDAQHLQDLLIGLLALLYAGLLWEVRALRRAKHRQAQVAQYTVLCIELIAQETNVMLPRMKVDRE